MTTHVRPARPTGATHAVFAPDGALHLTIALGAVHARSPFQPGDWVRCHGFPAAIPGPQRWGWRGYVLGAQGSTILHGLTDDGLPWSEHWGHLVRDGQRESGDLRCTCCCWPPRRPAPSQQLDIWSVLDAQRVVVIASPRGLPA